ncbi:Serine hydrolase-like protein [Eumeta japonica]|uniref:Serine hydrolase-like protein n=1 Tax=Eumeta variegata TaxID=151549 RepID=A0A4C1T9S8_EUMVA|nr:Serine hydrolase-like protein [Eumeta japonica]
MREWCNELMEMANISLTKVLSQAKPFICNLYLHARHIHSIPVKEVKIPTQWGFIAGKLWGNDQQRPILALHGWQDNAGTWDTLIPLLPKEYSFLAIDFPGHGQSSWYPPGWQSLTRLRTAFGDKHNAQCKTTICNCFEEFKPGCVNFSEEFCDGHLAISVKNKNIDAVPND